MRSDRDDKFDFFLLDALGNQALIVEAKSLKGASSAWASRFRDNLLKSGWAVKGSYFLLATPEQFFIWRPESRSTEPDFVVNASPILAPYFERAQIKPSEVHPLAYELIVGQWLQDLVDSPTEQGELHESGLPSAIHGGSVLQSR
ncbi:MAG: hypothetical protein AMXMBFR33_15600 [Candidatus Xenobia bacterium]